MTAILESYTLTCNACGTPKKVSRLQVDGNLAEIERTWVCPECVRAAAAARHEGDAAAPTPAANDAAG